MTFRRRGLLLATLSAAAPALHAGPLLEALRERRERRREAESPEEEGALQGRGAERMKAPPKLPPGARVLKDQAYGNEAQQTYDVYAPKEARGAPILFMVHGGAWMVGDKAYAPVVNNKITRWLPAGYVLVSVNYRMSRQPDVSAQADDVARALAHVQAHAAEWGGDASRMVLIGHSAGAHLVALLASAPALAARHGARPWLGTISLDSAVLNVSETMEAKHYRFYDQVFRDRGQWNEVSPFHRLTTAPKPMLLVCSTRRSDSCPQADAFAGKVHSLGGKASVMRVDLKHGETNTNLGLPSDYTENVHQFIRTLGLP